MEIDREIQQKKFDNDRHRARVNLLLTASWLTGEMKTFLEPYDITPKQFNILRILRGQHPGTVAIEEVRGRMIDRMSDVSRIIDRLVQKELVAKQPCRNDRRSTRVSITEAGLALLQRVDEQKEQLEASLRRLSDEETRQLNALLDKLRGDIV